MKELLTDIVGPRWAKRLTEIYRTPRGLGDATAKDLIDIGLPEGKAKALTAGVWLGFLSTQIEHKIQSITSPLDLYEVFKPFLRGEYESVAVIYVNKQKHILSVKEHSVGSGSMCIMDPKKLLREGLKVGAEAMFIGHNHPSGMPNPSTQDLEVTRRIIEASNVVSLPLIDHMIVCDGPVKYQSLRESHPHLWA